MTYLRKPFQHDLFVSYAHGRADRRGVKRLKHWSEQLKLEIEGEIVDLLPEFEPLNIFIDDELDPAAPLTEQLRDKVGHSGLLLVIMTEHYLNSAWCQDEREWFDAEVERRGKKGGLVLVIRVQPTDHARWPDCLKDERGHVVLGFQFHPDPKSDDDLVQPYGWPEPLPQDRPYYEELSKLANIITQRLRKLRKSQELEEKAHQPRAQIRIEGEPTIYLQAASSVPEDWAQIKAELEGAGCRVLPDELLVVEDDLAAIQAARKERLKILSGQAHALCLLRSRQTDRFEREIEATASDRTALEAFDKSLPCTILNLAGGDVPGANDFGIGVLDARDENWLGAFRDWLESAMGSGG